MNVIQFPKVKKSKFKFTEPSTSILIVDFKAKRLVGEVKLDNINNTVMEQWGKKPVPQKKVA